MGVVEALRVTFIGEYVPEEDDFDGRTYFARSLEESDNPQPFSRRDKQYCGFLYLRSLRTGRRALSLEHGSLLDIILRLKEIRPQLWETTINGLAEFDVASDPELGISGVLKSINTALNNYVPKEWGVEPHLRVSALTRDHLRNVITAFIATGEGSHAAPYYRQGTGTINMLVLAMLSQIAEDMGEAVPSSTASSSTRPSRANSASVRKRSRGRSGYFSTDRQGFAAFRHQAPALAQPVHVRQDLDGLVRRDRAARQLVVELDDTGSLQRRHRDPAEDRQDVAVEQTAERSLDMFDRALPFDLAERRNPGQQDRHVLACLPSPVSTATSAPARIIPCTREAGDYWQGQWASVDLRGGGVGSY